MSNPERMRIVTPRLSPTIEDYEILDTTFSDADKYPFLKELEICSLLMAQGGEKGGNTRGHFWMDEHLPRVRAMGRLPA